MKDSFVLYTQYAENIELLDYEQRGVLFTALFAHSMNQDLPEMDAITQMAFTFIRAQIDRDSEKYEEKRRQRSEAGKKSAETRRKLVEENSTEENLVERKSTEENFVERKSTEENFVEHNVYVNVNDNVNDNENDNENVNVKKKAPAAHAHGVYGWVKLTDEQFGRLCADLGESEVKRCIDYIDELAQSTSNKNKWRDWNLVVRRCSREKWGLNNARPKAKNAFANFSQHDTDYAELERQLDRQFAEMTD